MALVARATGSGFSRIVVKLSRTAVGSYCSCAGGSGLLVRTYSMSNAPMVVAGSRFGKKTHMNLVEHHQRRVLRVHLGLIPSQEPIEEAKFLLAVDFVDLVQGCAA